MRSHLPALIRLLLLVAAWQGASPAAAAGRYTVSAQGVALAPNAGGQEAYSLRLATNSWEVGAFSNQYIVTGKYPLTGAFYDRRFPICDDTCWWQFFVQTGGGLSTGGPFAQITWGTIVPSIRFVPALRLDISTQMIFIRYRGVTWSYPLWAGISVSF